MTVAEIREKVTALISENYASNRVEAEKDVIQTFMKKAGKLKALTKEQKRVLVEVAFLAEVIDVKAASKIKAMVEMILLKPVDLYEYQKKLKELLA